MRYSSLLRFAVRAVIAAGILLILPGQAKFDLGIASAWADDSGDGGRNCPGGK
jgi:hypothetical protein